MLVFVISIEQAEELAAALSASKGHTAQSNNDGVIIKF